MLENIRNRVYLIVTINRHIFSSSTIHAVSAEVFQSNDLSLRDMWNYFELCLKRDRPFKYYIFNKQVDAYEEFKKKWDEIYGAAFDEIQPSTDFNYGYSVNQDGDQSIISDDGEWETVDNGGGYFTVNRVKKSKTPQVTTEAAKKCNHVWRHYVGLTQRYDFCEICDLKRESK